MKDLFEYKYCPVSGLPITINQEWKYVAKDGSCTIEIAIIGDNILYIISSGIINGKANKWYAKTANTIISDYFGDRKYYLSYDYSSLINTTLESKKIFIKWLLSKKDKIELVTVFGMNQIIKVAIKTARIISKKDKKLLLTNSYKESIVAILQSQNKSEESIGTGKKSKSNITNDEQTENTRINELIGYLGKMTWAGDLNQKIPVLSDNDPFAELFTAVAVNQDDLREIERDKNETQKKLRRSISEKDEAIKKLSTKETLILSMLEDAEKQKAETKKTYEQLVVSEEKFRTIFENAPVLIDAFDTNGKCILWNNECEKTFGYSIEEVNRAKNPLALFYPDDNMHTEVVKTVVSEPDKIFREWNPHTKDGNILSVLWANFRVSDSLVINIGHNISERKQAEMNLILAKEKAEESNRLKTAFINNMSHEIRTPLNGINGFLELLQNIDYDAVYKQDYIDIVNTSSKRLINTISDIMVISEIEAGYIDVFIEDVYVNKMLVELYDYYSIEAKDKGFKLIQTPSLSDDEALILTDKYKLNRILSNLVKNAIKFTQKGVVTFGYELITDTLKFYVKDTGVGIAENRQQAIFNRFEQADIDDTRAFEGSGLGLTIAKSYVEMLGGKIWFKSEEGIGTEFMFTIPYKTKSQQPTANSQQGNLKALSVLIVEDEKISNQLFEMIFKDTFKQTIYVKTGQQAIDVCKDNQKIDLILMDIKMPLMDGYVATREIRKFNKEIIIIAQTAYGLARYRGEAIKAGCNDYISKPINKNKLFEMIKFHFSII